MMTQASIENAVEMYGEAYDRGDVRGACAVGQALEQLGDLAGAREWYGRALSVPETPSRLARVLRALGEDDEAWQVLRDGRDVSWEAAVDYALDRRVPDGEAVALLESHLRRGNVDVEVTLAGFYEDAGREVEAERPLRDAAGRGDTHAMTNLGVFVDERGHRAEAIGLWKASAEQGDELAARLLRDET